MSRTTDMTDEERRQLCYEADFHGPCTLAAVHSLCWKAGLELPPFVSTNVEAVQLLCGILDGTIAMGV